jgi:hypothetical protein
MFRHNKFAPGSGGKKRAQTPEEKFAYARDCAIAFDAALGTDAASSSAMAFLTSALELIDPDVVEPLQETTHQRDIDVEFGGGYPQELSIFASNYGSTGGQQYGLQGTNNTDIPMTSVDIQKNVYPVIPWAGGFSISLLDMKRIAYALKNGQQPPISLQEFHEKAINGTFVKMLDGLTYEGFQGNYGLANNPNVPAFVVPSGGAGTAWSTKTPVQWLNDVNTAQNICIINSGFAAQKGCPNTLLLPLNPQFALLSAPMTIGGIGYDSASDYIIKHCIATRLGVPFKIDFLPNPWISSTANGGSFAPGLGGLDRGIMYRKDKDSLYLKVPTRAELALTLPSTRQGAAYESIYMGAVAPVIWRRTTSIAYMDGI